MNFRPITAAQAEAIRAILVDECGYVLGDHDSFVNDVRTDNMADKPHRRTPCDEYRFMGSLGFGGKFRNNGNHDNVPHVDCYPEDMTQERMAKIGNANRRLVALFKDAP